jgi:hypothetical protein
VITNCDTETATDTDVDVDAGKELNTKGQSMADTWDDDYLNDLEDGHTFADKYLSDRPRPPMEGMHRSEDDPYFDRDAADVNMSPGAQGRSRRIDPGVIEAKFPGTCTECQQRIHVNDPIVAGTSGGWRHAGCGTHRIPPRYQEPF